MPDLPDLDALLNRLPHAGTARLPDAILSLEPGARVTAIHAVSAGDPRVSVTGELPAVLLVELMAQAGGLLVEQKDGEHEGALMAGVRRMHLHGTARAGETVVVECRLARKLGEMYLISASASCEGRSLAHGEILLRRASMRPMKQGTGKP
ncbi:MAG: 3-hydroxyacyl-ACP dehydratase FabZ family protein [Candidatus Polarisedimenticolia bacterium]